MKKFLNVMLPIFIMAIVVFMCAGMYLFFTTGTFMQSNNSALSTEKIDEDIILTQNELPRIGCSAITKQLTSSIIKNFTQDENIADNVFDVDSTEEEFNKLIKDEIDVLISTYPTDDIMTFAKLNGVDLEITPIAKDGFVFFTNVDNKIDSLKVSDIQKIYTGQIKNWSELGGENIDIKAFQHPENSPTQNEMINSVMKNLKIDDAPKDVFYTKKFGEIDDLIATYMILMGKSIIQLKY